ncbi:uncharacterized protein F5Z01DRAFT_681361 [Emericellopsis atlantica]|uniref:Uncharacterized protein n=1 Tax=Emericellopsis atlantica TaxID=2614577 RepID=A0A9P7ZLF2_9HYPO|nr:uncharacterized protein F5Z01DRAFT_681361 [Emericellopsis atlantica]KAG9254269.1 hypothetical protein F5Z01DRAFT_681361 [Emericellopsis atlantica]
MTQLNNIVHTALLLAGTVAAGGCKTFPASMDEYSAGFKQPEPPLVKSEFTTSFVQHKWNENVSHIAAGFITNSASKGVVHVDLAFDGSLASSVFNYANVTDEGLVDNTVTTLLPNSTTLDVWQDYVNPNFPIFPEDILVQSDAVFSGLVDKKFLTYPVAAWSIMYQGVIPTTVYVDNTGMLVGYDYFSPGLRTRVITEFFNTKATA